MKEKSVSDKPMRSNNNGLIKMIGNYGRKYDNRISALKVYIINYRMHLLTLQTSTITFGVSKDTKNLFHKIADGLDSAKTNLFRYFFQ